MTKDILSQIKTKDDILNFVSCLDAVSQSRYTGESPGAHVSNDCLEVLDYVNKMSNAEISALRREITAQNTFVVRVPFGPSEDFRSKLYELLAENYKDQFVLEFIVANDMDFGVDLSLNGRYLQCSLKSTILNYLKNKDVI